MGQEDGIFQSRCIAGSRSSQIAMQESARQGQGQAEVPPRGWVKLFFRRCQGLGRARCEQKHHSYLTFYSIRTLILVSRKAPQKERSFVYKIHKLHQPTGQKNKYRVTND